MTNNLALRLRSNIPSITISGLGLLATSVLVYLENYLVSLTPSLPTILLIRIIAALVLIISLLVSYIYLLRPNLKPSEKFGTLIDKKTGIHYCTSCKSKNINTPLKKSPLGYRCFVSGCEAFYRNPDYKPPSPPSENHGPNSWMRL